MSELNYVPSWLDSAMTLLEKLNKCIEKIETIVNTVVSVTKTANDALNLANTNEADITTLENKTATLETKTATLETKTATLETKTTTLETNVDAAKQEAKSAYSLANLANTTANTAQALANDTLDKTNQNTTDITALQNEKSGKIYLHIIVVEVLQYRFKFWTINDEREAYRDKFNSEQAFTVTLDIFNEELMRVQDTTVSKCLTLRVGSITFTHTKTSGGWSTQNSNGVINFAAYLDDSNQIVTITDLPVWNSATILNERVIGL